MKRIIGHMICLLIGICAFAAYGLSPEEFDRLQERNAWLDSCIAEFAKAKVGMTRTEIDSIFSQDGGLHGFQYVRYRNPDCDYFKIDITYAPANPSDSDGRHLPSPNDRVAKISKPYLEHPYSD